MATRRTSRATARRRSARRARAAKSQYRRPLRYEPLEDRRLLAVVTVDTPQDTVDFTDGLLSLREAIFATNTVPGADTIEFDASLDGATIVLTEGELQVTDSLTIDATALAAGLTIDASGNDLTPEENNGDGSRVLNIDDGNDATLRDVTLRGFTITGGDVGFAGGGIYGLENLTVDQCTITDNYAEIGGGGVAVGRDYGAISGATFVMSGSTIIDNSAPNSGGLEIRCAFVTISGCTMSGNSAGYGAGGAHISGTTVLVTGCTVMGNTSYDGAGGLSVGGQSVTVDGCTISGNTSEDGAGGLAAGGRTSLAILNTTISGNTSSRLAGGLWVENFDIAGGGPVTVAGCTIADNASTDYDGSGGGYVWASTVTVTDSTVSGNTAYDGRCGLTVDGDTIAISGCTFADNRAVRSDGYGGGLSVGHYTSVKQATVDHCTFTGNSALAGGGVYVYGQDITIDSVTVSGNSAMVGAGIDIRQRLSGAGLITDCVVENNTASGGAGGILAEGNVTIRRTMVNGNSTARWQGGGISASGGVVIENCDILGNTGVGGGGVNVHRVISVPEAPVTITGSTIAGNTAIDKGGHSDDGLGGGILADYYMTGGEPVLFVTNCTIEHNVAQVAGGGIADGSHGPVVIVGSTIAHNSAEEGGGIWATVADVDQCTISHNAAVRGGGVFTGPYASGDTSIRNSTIAFNEATAAGGGLWADDDTVLTQCTVSSNLAAVGAGIYTIGNTTVEHSTVARNEAVATGSGIMAAAGTLNLDHTIVAWHTGLNPDITTVAGSVVNARYSLVEDNEGSGLTEAPVGAPDENGNLIGGAVYGTIEPVLTPLADNGGPTMTHALLPGSPAIDMGDPAFDPADQDGEPGTTDALIYDQRGEPFDRVVNGRIDVGACERQDSEGLQSLLVDTPSDETDSDYSAGHLSLREAIALANLWSTADVIRFAPALSGGTILLTHGELLISADLSIEGLGAARLTIDASASDPTPDEADGDGSRVFNVDDKKIYLPEGEEPISVAISDVTLTGGDVDAEGGAVRSMESLSLVRTMVRQNSSQGLGGGIWFYTNAEYTAAQLTIRDCTIASNFASCGGGVSVLLGLYGNAPKSPVNIVNSTISGNTAVELGGGVYAYSAALHISHCTITGNTFQYRANRPSWGGGVWVGPVESVEIDHTIVAGNFDEVGNPSDAVLPTDSSTIPVVVRSSLIGSEAGSGLTEAPVGSPDENGNLIGGSTYGVIDPMLGPLTDNGGPTLTHALLPGSPAIDMGDPSAVAGANGVPEYDQRGEPYTRVYGGRIDVGAVESQPNPLAGDYNTDGGVDAADYSVWRDTLGSTTDLRADGSGAEYGTPDGVVDEYDYAFWKANFGHHVVLPAMASAARNASPTTTASQPPALLATASRPWRPADSDTPIAASTLAQPDPPVATGDSPWRAEPGAGWTSPVGVAALLTSGSIVVTTDQDTVDFTDGVLSLREAIFATNTVPGADTIEFDASLDGATIVLTEGELQVTDSLTIDASALAAGLTIDASGNDLTPDENLGDGSRIFNIDDGDDAVMCDVTLRGLTITGGDAKYQGGGILSVEQLTINHCAVIGNYSNRGGGGGVYVELWGDGSVTIDDSTISANLTGSRYSSSGQRGGGVHVRHEGSGCVTVTGSLISANTSGYDDGGGLWIDGPDSTLVIADSTISGNYAHKGHYFDRTGGKGGGLYTRNQSVTISDSLVSDNTSENSGGGLWIEADNTTITGSTISRNRATGSLVEGGGLCVEGTLAVQLSTISDNSADRGGGISFDGTSMVIEDTTISQNVAEIGGGVYSYSTPGGATSVHIEFVSTTVADNLAQSRTWGGGGIYCSGIWLDLAGCDVAGNSTADRGGGIYSYGPTSIVDSRIVGNHLYLDTFASPLGAGIFHGYYPLTIVNSSIVGNFINNSASGDGGGLYAESGAQVTIESTRIADNSVHGRGGGAFVEGELALFSSTISGNSGGSGGGLYLISSDSAESAIVDSTISGNDAGVNGGGIHIATESTTPTLVRHSTVTKNRAGLALASSGGFAGGAGVFLESGPLALDHSIVAGNSTRYSEVKGADLTGLLGSSIQANFSLIGDNQYTGLAEAPVGAPDASGNLIGGPTYGKIDPLLGPLVDNGGPTLTNALLPGSPAINMGDPSAVAGANGVPLYDQRGEPYDRIYAGRIDIGAVESQPNPLAGDYNTDGGVDAADYSVWRDTLGSTTDLRADGSGPDYGTPDGVVDEYDYTFWKANFGHTLTSVTPPSAALNTLPPATASQPPALPGDSDTPIAASTLAQPDPPVAPASRPWQPEPVANGAQLAASQLVVGDVRRLSAGRQLSSVGRWHQRRAAAVQSSATDAALLEIGAADRVGAGRRVLDRGAVRDRLSPVERGAHRDAWQGEFAAFAPAVDAVFEGLGSGV